MVKLLGRLSFPWLILGFCAGLAATLMIEPKRRVVVEFPSPYNAGKITYARPASDGGGRCFQFRADRVMCPAEGDRQVAKDQPMAVQLHGQQAGEPFLDSPPATQSPSDCAVQPLFLQDGPHELSPLCPAT